MPFPPAESRVQGGSVDTGGREAHGCREPRSPAAAWLLGPFPEAALRAGAMWLQQKPRGLADEENDDASGGSGPWGKVIKPSADWAPACPHKS